MRGRSGVLCFWAFFAFAFTASASELIVPAGTLLQCTISEPNFSSKTAEIGEPVLCEAGQMQQFGRSAFPKGAALVGHLVEFKDPGHFVGRGWLQLEFDRIVLPDQVVPLSAKVVHASHFRVDGKGKIHGKGHTGRDTAEWLFPPLWPWKVVSIPLRGPRPALKGENRITLKLMDDVVLPRLTTRIVCPPGSADGGNCISEPESAKSRPAVSPATGVSPVKFDGAPVFGTTSAPRAVLTSFAKPENRAPDAKRFTLLLLQDGTARVATQYWFEDGRQIKYTSAEGATKYLPIASLNLSATVETNRRRGVEFVIRSEDAEN